MKLEKGCDKKNISPEMNRGRRSYRRSWVCRDCLKRTGIQKRLNADDIKKKIKKIAA
jgi:hypothetical protein